MGAVKASACRGASAECKRPFIKPLRLDCSSSRTFRNSSQRKVIGKENQRGDESTAKLAASLGISRWPSKLRVSEFIW